MAAYATAMGSTDAPASTVDAMCAAYVASDAGNAMYNCMAAAYDGVDCSTMDAMTAAGTAAGECAGSM